MVASLGKRKIEDIRALQFLEKVEKLKAYVSFIAQQRGITIVDLASRSNKNNGKEKPLSNGHCALVCGPPNPIYLIVLPLSLR